MRVLLATPYKISSGGISRWAEHIISHYKKSSSNVEIEIMPLNDPKELNIEDFISKTPINRILMGVRKYTYASRLLWRKLQDEKYDILHIASSATLGLLKDILMTRIAHRHGVKCIIHFHFGRIPELSKLQNWEWKMLCYVVRKADKIVVIDTPSYKTLTAMGISNVVYISNPLAPAINTFVSSFNEKRIDRTLLFAGQCVANKGVYELVEACRDIANVELKILGAITKSMENDLLSRWTSTSKLSILGNRPFEEVIREMCLCDIFVLPSYTEGFPNVILESMACGCAIVTTPVGAIPEMLAEENGNHYGIMVEPRNVERLKAAIEYMFLNPIFKEECRVNVQHRVNERYNIDSIWSCMVALWHEVVEN